MSLLFKNNIELFKNNEYDSKESEEVVENNEEVVENFVAVPFAGLSIILWIIFIIFYFPLVIYALIRIFSDCAKKWSGLKKGIYAFISICIPLLGAIITIIASYAECIRKKH